MVLSVLETSALNGKGAYVMLGRSSASALAEEYWYGLCDADMPADRSSRSWPWRSFRGSTKMGCHALASVACVKVELNGYRHRMPKSRLKRRKSSVPGQVLALSNV